MMPLHTNRPPRPSPRLRCDRWMLPDDETVFLVSRDVGPRNRPPRPSARLRWDCSMLPDDETVYLVQRDEGPRFSPTVHPYGGALSRDQTPASEYSDLNRLIPRHRFSDSTVIVDEVSRRTVALSEEAIANHMENRVRRRQNDAVSEEDGLCVVCLEDLVEENGRIARLDCGHDYHFHCINKWLNRSNTCPLCKAAVILTIN